MVSVGISELILEVFGGDGRTHGVRDLVVNFVKDWINSHSLQFGIASIVPFNEMVCLPTLDWMDKDCARIMIVEEKDIVHTTGGGEWKTPRLIHTDHGVELVEFNSRGADEMVPEKEIWAGLRAVPEEEEQEVRKYCGLL